MEVNKEKENFIFTEFIPQLREIRVDFKPLWGKMNLQQMVEHMTDSITMATGKNKHKEVITPADRLEQSYNFMMSDKPFKENTRNSLLPDEPSPVLMDNLENAIVELERELNEFRNHFRQDPEKKTVNPFFGHLNYAEWIQLFHKHAKHHLKQFGID